MLVVTNSSFVWNTTDRRGKRGRSRAPVSKYVKNHPQLSIGARASLCGSANEKKRKEVDCAFQFGTKKTLLPPHLLFFFFFFFLSVCAIANCGLQRPTKGDFLSVFLNFRFYIFLEVRKQLTNIFCFFVFFFSVKYCFCALFSPFNPPSFFWPLSSLCASVPQSATSLLRNLSVALGPLLLPIVTVAVHSRR